MGTHAKRFLTREEFRKQFGHSFGNSVEWNTRGRMNYLFGCVYSGDPANCIPVQHAANMKIVTNSWHIQDQMLTDAPHPYMNKLIMVRVTDEQEWNQVQAKGFSCGFKWIQAGYEWKTYKYISERNPNNNVTVYISKGKMFTGVEEPDTYDLISIDDFMTGTVPVSTTRCSDNEPLLPPIPVSLLKHDKYMCVMDANQRELYGAVSLPHPMLLLSDKLDDGGRQISGIDKYLESGYTMLSCDRFMTMFPPVSLRKLFGYDIRVLDTEYIGIGCERISIAKMNACVELLDILFRRTDAKAVTLDTLKQVQEVMKRVHTLNKNK